MASALMLLGIGLFGAITAIVTNTLLAASHDDSSDALADLERLAALRATDAISPEEFETAKGRLLARV